MAAKYNSATSVQHIMKMDTVTLTAEATVANGSGGVTLNTRNGVSKTATIEKQGTGKYAIYWDVPAQVTLGVPQVAVINAASGSGDLYSVQVLSKFTNYNSSPVAGISFQVFQTSGSTEAAPVNPPQNAILVATVVASTSPVF